MDPTKEQYVAELNRYATPQIAEIFKVSEAAVTDWKAGNNVTGAPVIWEVVVRILNEKGTPIA